MGQGACSLARYATLRAAAMRCSAPAQRAQPGLFMAAVVSTMPTDRARDLGAAIAGDHHPLTALRFERHNYPAVQVRLRLVYGGIRWYSLSGQTSTGRGCGFIAEGLTRSDWGHGGVVACAALSPDVLATHELRCGSICTSTPRNSSSACRQWQQGYDLTHGTDALGQGIGLKPGRVYRCPFSAQINNHGCSSNHGLTAERAFPQDIIRLAKTTAQHRRTLVNAHHSLRYMCIRTVFSASATFLRTRHFGDGLVAAWLPSDLMRPSS